MGMLDNCLFLCYNILYTFLETYGRYFYSMAYNPKTVNSELTNILEFDIKPAEMMFVHKILEGYTQLEAYRIAFPEKKAKSKYATINASKLLRTASVNAYYTKLLHEIKGKAIDANGSEGSIVWTRKIATEKLKNVIYACEGILRDQAYVRNLRIKELMEEQDEVEANEEMEEGRKRDKLKAIKKEIYNIMGKDTNSKYACDTIINCTKELNKLHGLVDETSVNGNISFINMQNVPE